MSILKFDRQMLFGGDMFVRKKYDNKTFPTHWHDYYEIIMYGGCIGKCCFNGTEYAIKDECIFFLTPTDFHRIDVNDSESGYSVNISFNERAADGGVLENGELYPCVVYQPSEYLKSTVNRLAEIFSEKQTDKSHLTECRNLLSIILIMITREGIRVNSNTYSVNKNIRNAMRLILSDISLPHTLENTAKGCGLSPSHFSFLFHKETGVPFKKWLDHIRIDHAKRLLESENSRVLDVALECGFSSSSHFIRTFREKNGMTPAQWRKSD